MQPAQEGHRNLADEILDSLLAQVILLDEKGQIRAFNEAYQRLGSESGWVSATGTGRVGLDYLTTFLRTSSAGEEEQIDVAREGLRAVLQAEIPIFQMTYHREALGRAASFLLNITQFRGSGGGAVVSHIDITNAMQRESWLAERNREMERDIAERSSELETFFSVSLDLLCIANTQGYFTRVNPAFTETLGWSMQEFLERPFFEFVHPDDRRATELETARLAKPGEPQKFENRYRHKNGSWRTLVWSSVPMGDGKIYATARDMTQQRSMEDSLRAAKEEAEKANLAKSEFLSRMSHELRTPMNAVLGYAQLLDLKHDDGDIKHATRSIMKGGRHLLQLINEVLDLSRIESGNLGISIEPVPVDSLLREAVSLLTSIAQDAGIAISLGDCDGVYVEADSQRLLQVFLNIVGNGIKYNKPGGSVSILCFEQPGEVCRIEISDTGEGISPEAQAQLFQPFQRFGDPGIEGAGLGLAVSDRFTRLMGGRVGLADSSSTGSTFFIELKKSQAPKTDAAPVIESESAPLSSRRAGTVLYIEDNPSNIELVETVLADWKDIRLFTAQKGEAGLDLANDHRPDLILLDLHLPDLMGDKVLKRLKANPLTESITVVMLSADATRRQIDAALKAGAAEYLTKPLDIGRLFEVLEEYLPNRS